MSDPVAIPAGIYVRILDEVEYFGTHEFWVLPRVGETIRLSRSDADHTLTVRRVEHSLIPLGHSIRLICD